MKAILQTCVDVEERVGEIYQQLVKHPYANDELREIWQEMADDEMRHAQRVRSVAERFEVAGVLYCDLSLEVVQGLFERAGELLLAACEKRLSLEEAISASVELEDTFLKVHLGYAKSANHPDLQTMFKALAEEDRQHTLRLKSFLDRMNDGNGMVFDKEGNAE